MHNVGRSFIPTPMPLRYFYLAFPGLGHNLLRQLSSLGSSKMQIFAIDFFLDFHHPKSSNIPCKAYFRPSICVFQASCCAPTRSDALLSRATTTMSSPRGGPLVWGELPELYGHDDPFGWWVLLGGRPALLQPGRLLSEYAAERHIPGDCSVAFACPGADPLGLRRLRAADFDYFDDSDIKNNAAVALPLAPACNRERQGRTGRRGRLLALLAPRCRPFWWHWRCRRPRTAANAA